MTATDEGMRMATGWDAIVGQADAVAQLQRAAAIDPASDGAEDRSGGMTHAWLLTGPPGSGRSNLAYAFATALLSPPSGIDERVATLVEARTHPDLVTLSTEGVLITIAQARSVVQRASLAPSSARYRVIVVEDADRMAERTSNVLLKALEEPPPRTVWILCAPNAADLIPTIRSRVRTVRLRVPTVAEVAALLERRDGIPADLASRAAREAQSHIGMAHRLATDQDARERRARSLDIALGVGSVSGAVLAAEQLVAVATDDAKALTIERDQVEREAALRSLGIEPGGTVPPALRSQLKALEEDQKRRATRSVRDGIDRVLVDLTSLYRDILTVQLGAEVDLVNEAIRDRIVEAARASTPERMLAALDAIALARRRIEGNMPPAMALEAMLISASGRVPALGSPA